MAELSPAERDFLSTSAQGRSYLSGEKPEPRRTVREQASSKLGEIGAGLIRSIPLILGIATIAATVILVYFYFMVSTYLGGNTSESLESLKSYGGALQLDDSTISALESLESLQQTLPWIIFGALSVGFVLTVLSFYIIRRKNG